MPYTAEFIIAAIEITLGRKQYVAPKEKKELDQLAEMSSRRLEFPFNDRDKLVILKHELYYAHHNDHVVFLKKRPQQEGRKIAAVAEYWYRCVGENEYAELIKGRGLPQSDSFGGICTNRDYAANYLTNESGKAIVEWHIPPVGRLSKLMEEAGIQIKAEGDGGTFGLGEKGTSRPKVAKGQVAEKPSAYEIWDQYCGSKFEVVDLKIKNTIMDVIKKLQP